MQRLNAFAAQKRLRTFDRLKQGLAPDEGLFDEAIFREGKVKGPPQMGATRFSPFEITFEFIFPDPKSSATVFSVTIPSPERIVFMPVPGWVIESIWQGDIDGSFVFESDAEAAVADFVAQLSHDRNEGLFGPKAATRRE